MATPSPSSHDHSGAAYWHYADGCAVPFESLGPGPRAALVNGLRLQALIARWGWPLHPDEPDSQTAARLMWDITVLNDLIVAYDTLGGPAAARRIAALENDWAMTIDYLTGLLASERAGLDTSASSANEYIAAINAATMPLARDTRIDYAALKDRIDIVAYASRFTRLRPTGAGRHVGRCPLPGHNDSTPSFWVYPASRSWYCFGCATGGDVFDLARHFDMTARDLANGDAA